MDRIKAKIYKTFDEFFEDSHNLAEFIKNNTNSLADSEKIAYARKVYDETILNSFIVIGQISKEIKELLNCQKSELRFSMDNMIKNKLAHPEVSIDDYKKISSIIKNPSKYYKSKSGYDVILFKADEKFYKLVIKTTKNKKENFVKSLHLLNADRYRKY